MFQLIFAQTGAHPGQKSGTNPQDVNQILRQQVKSLLAF